MEDYSDELEESMSAVMVLSSAVNMSRLRCWPYGYGGAISDAVERTAPQPPYTCTHAHTYLACIHTYIHAYIHVCIYVCRYVGMYVCMYVCISMYVYVYIYIYICIYMCIYIYASLI